VRRKQGKSNGPSLLTFNNEFSIEHVDPPLLMVVSLILLANPVRSNMKGKSRAKHDAKVFQVQRSRISKQAYWVGENSLRG
jgi:hypothetical protein